MSLNLTRQTPGGTPYDGQCTMLGSLDPIFELGSIPSTPILTGLDRSFRPPIDSQDITDIDSQDITRDTIASEGDTSRFQIFTEARDKDVGPDRQNVPRSPGNVLIDTVARLQQDLADMKAKSRYHRTPGVPPIVPTPRHVAFTLTKVPRFTGTTSWDQYRQVFDAIVLSNGWDDATAALQLLSHLEGDTLNVPLLDALSAHYCSPGDWRTTGDSLRKRLGRQGRTLHIRDSLGSIGRKGIWRYGSDRATTADPRSLHSGT